MKLKLSVWFLLVALLTGSVAVLSTPSIASAECISASGNGDADVLLGPFDMSAGSSVTITMTAGQGGGSGGTLAAASDGTRITIYVDTISVVVDTQYVTPHTLTYTFDTDTSNVEILLDWQYVAAANTYEVTSSDCAVAGCPALVNIPSQAVMGQFVMDAPVLRTPDAGSATGLTVTAGKTYRVTGQDATGQFRQIILECSFVWVPANTVGTYADAVWPGAPLPTTVVK